MYWDAAAPLQQNARNPTGLVPWIVRFSHYPIAGYLPPSARPDQLWSGRAEGEGLARGCRVARSLTIHGTSPVGFQAFC